jgi:hypothetical protein
LRRAHQIAANALFEMVGTLRFAHPTNLREMPLFLRNLRFADLIGRWKNLFVDRAGFADEAGPLLL